MASTKTLNDEFSSNAKWREYELSENNSCVTRAKYTGGCVYLKKKVWTGFHCWKFKLVRLLSHTVIGIRKMNQPIDTYHELWHPAHTGKIYGLYLGHSGIHAYVTDGSNSKQPPKYATACKTGDVVEMILNLDRCELSYSINGKYQGIAFQNITKCDYSACISMCGSNGCIKLISYKSGVDESDDSKMNKELQEEHKALQSTFNEEIAARDSKISSILIEKDELQRKFETKLQTEKNQNEVLFQEKKLATQKYHESQQKIDSTAKTNEALVRNVKELEEDINKKEKEHKSILQKKEIEATRKYEELMQKLSQIEKEKIKLQQAHDELKTEHKEMQLELLDARKKCRVLQKKPNLDESKYMEWDANMCVDWIVSLSEEYEQYEDDLRKSLTEDGADGSMLGDLDKNDLRGWGVKNLKHRIAVIKSLKRLTSQSYQQKIATASQNEGSAETEFIK